jgi:hypothetical protein
MSDIQTASARIIAEAAETVEHTDGLGRKLVIGKLSVLDQARILKAIGSEQSNNGPFVQIAMASCCIRSVNGIPCPTPRTPSEVEAAIDRMGDAAYLVVIVQMAKWSQAASDAIDGALKSSFEESVKN